MEISQVDTISEEGPSRSRSILSFLFWACFAIGCLLFFTALKLPQAKINAYVTSYISNQLAPMGIQFSADEGGLELGLAGIHYDMKGVKLTRTANGKTARVSEVSVSPAILALLQGKLGGHIVIHEGPGELKATVLAHGEDTEISFNATSVNLGRMGVLPFALGIEGSAEIRGEGEIVGNFRTPSSLSGEVKLTVSKLVLDAQSLYGFKIPRIGISDGDIQVALGGGKATINQFRLGKQGASDDIFATLTGDLKLGLSADASTADVRGKVGFSEALKPSLAALDIFLSKYRLPDGTIAFRLSGPLNSLPLPDQG